MDCGVTVVTNPTVAVRLTSTLSSFESNRRFNRGITIAEFKVTVRLLASQPLNSISSECSFTYFASMLMSYAHRA